MKKIITTVAIAILIGFTFISLPSYAADFDNGVKIFEANCAGCHANGGNIVRRGKNLKLRALHRNKVDNLEAIMALVTNGKNNMPAYGDRLTASEIENVSAYVLERAEHNWK